MQSVQLMRNAVPDRRISGRDNARLPREGSYVHMLKGFTDFNSTQRHLLVMTLARILYLR